MNRAKWQLLALFLTGCEGPHALVYNMTTYPIEVTYSDANIRDWTVELDPGYSARVFGARSPDLVNLVVREGTGATRIYTEKDLAGMRRRWSKELWAYFPDGLHFIRRAPVAAAANGVTRQSCK
jgi:hypothetical protein